MKTSVAALVAALFFAPVSSAFAQGTPFVRIGATVSLSVSSISSRVALVTTSPTVWVCNTGATLANVGFGDSGYVATSADTPIPAGLCGNLSPNGGAYMAAITASSTTTITATPGTGAILGAGGGSGSGGGGGGAVTMVSGAVASGAYAAGSLAVGAGADGWDTTEGTKADSAANNSTSSWSVVALLKGLYAQLSSILTAVQNGIAATGSAVPADAAYQGVSTAGNLTGLVVCGSHVFKHITSATDTLAVQGVTSQAVKICGYKASFAGTNAVFLENTASTNANCSSSNTQITGQDSGIAQSLFGFYNAAWAGLANTSGNGVCINTTGSGAVDVDIWYTQGS